MTVGTVPWPPTTAVPDRTGPSALADATAAQESLRRERRRRTLWIREAKVAAVGYAVNAFSLALFAATGTVHWSAAVVYLLPGWMVCATACWLVASGRSAHWRDPSASGCQSFASMALCAVGIAVYPEVSFVYVLVLFTVFIGVTYRMPRTRTRVAWLVVMLSFAAATLSGHRSFQVPHATGAEQAVGWFCFAATLARFTLLSMINTSHNLLLRQRADQMRSTLAQIAHLAEHDELTGALNRRSMQHLIGEEIARAERTGTRFSVAMLDLDRFKAVNDTHGHLAGDQVLKRFAGTVRQHQRHTDRFGRHGGEEFVLLMPETATAEAAQAVERLREQLSTVPWGDVAAGLTVTFSAGVATHRAGETIEQLLARADHGLYGAKHAGRNCLRFG